MGNLTFKKGRFHRSVFGIFFLAAIFAFLHLDGALSLASEKSMVKDQTQKSIKKLSATLFDFDSDNAVSAWKAVNDTVMGGVSSSQIQKLERDKAVFTGHVSLDNNGGFASIRSPRVKQSLGDYTGISIRVKGDGKIYKCGLRTDDSFDGVFHQASFKTKVGEWQLVKIPFMDFIPTYHGRRLSEDSRMKHENIRSVSFLIADKQSGPFSLEIDWIKAYR